MAEANGFTASRVPVMRRNAAIAPDASSTSRQTWGFGPGAALIHLSAGFGSDKRRFRI